MILKLAPILLLVAARAWPQSPVIPDTPAGHTLRAWLDAFNSGDRARIQAYVAKYDPTGSADGTVSFRERTGGFDLLGVDNGDRLHIEFRVKERASTTVAVCRLEGKGCDSAGVAHFRALTIAPRMNAADTAMK